MIDYGTELIGFPMMVLFAKDIAMLLVTKGSEQQKTTRSCAKEYGEVLGKSHVWDYELIRPELEGNSYGTVTIDSTVVRVRKSSSRKREYVHVTCKCGLAKWILLDNLKRGAVKGCRQCQQPRRAPKWLYVRLNAAKDRCCNVNNSRYQDYGGRGIEFRFARVIDAAVYCLEQLGATKEGQLDRKDNDGHYEIGNLRWTTAKLNMNNQRVQLTAKLHRFRMLHPDIKYADSTLLAYFGKGMTEKELIHRWSLGKKPRGYGILSTPDPEIALLCRDF